MLFLLEKDQQVCWPFKGILKNRKLTFYIKVQLILQLITYYFASKVTIILPFCSTPAPFPRSRGALPRNADKQTV